MATILGTSGIDDLVGTNDDDTIKAYAGDDTLFGGGGRDKMIGGKGADDIDGGTGDDWADYRESSSGIFIEYRVGTGFVADGGVYVYGSTTYGAGADSEGDVLRVRLKRSCSGRYAAT